MLGKDIMRVIECEILDNSDFVNIDKSDIEQFKRNIDKVKLELIECRADDIATMFKNTLSKVISERVEYKLSKLLFVIKTSEETLITMNDLSFISEIEECDGGIVWGMSIDRRLPQDKVKIIILCGFIYINQ